MAEQEVWALGIGVLLGNHTQCKLHEGSRSAGRLQCTRPCRMGWLFLCLCQYNTPGAMSFHRNHPLQAADRRGGRGWDQRNHSRSKVIMLCRRWRL